MDGATIDQKVWRGRGIAAQHIGHKCQIFRPNNATDPFNAPLQIIMAAFNAADSVYSKPNLYGKAVWYADLDGRLTRSGDYLARWSDHSFWFIAAQQSLLPIVVIGCNAKVLIQRQGTNAVCGVGEYSGAAPQAPVLGTVDTMWPASVLVGGRAVAAIGLPGDVKESGWRILLPSSVPSPIMQSDIVQDDLGRRFAVESAESTDLGWRLTANEVHT